MRVSTRSLSVLVSSLIGLLVGGSVESHEARSQNSPRPVIATAADFQRAMKELSNWGRWGEKDELGAANLITPAKRKQALALAREGLTVSLAHDVIQEKAVDAPTILDRAVVTVSPSVALDRYQYSGTYHGVTHSHLDAVDCHIMVDGKGYNGVSMDEIKAANGCPRGSIHALKDGVVTRGILFDATRLPGKATAQGWLEPGTAIHREDLEALEKIQRVRVSPGDVILLYTGRWKRRAALGPWPNATALPAITSTSRISLRSAAFHSLDPMGPMMSLRRASRKASDFINWRWWRWVSASSIISISKEPPRKPGG